MKITKDDIGKKFYRRDGDTRIITGQDSDGDFVAGSDKDEWYYYVVPNGELYGYPDQKNDSDLIERIEEDMKTLKEGYYTDDEGKTRYIPHVPSAIKNEQSTIAYYLDGLWNEECGLGVYDWEYLGKEPPTCAIKIKSSKGKWIEKEISRESFDAIQEEL